jgi:hypothetical protein
MRARGERLLGVVAVVLLTGAVTVIHTSPAEAQGKAPAAAKAEDPKETAKKRYGEATKLFKAEDYAGALPLFQQADELYPGAAPKHKVAVCFDKLGKNAEAVDAYKKFIGSDPGEKYTKEVEDAKARIAELEKGLPGKVMLKVMPEGVAGVSVSVDGNAVEGTELELEAGKEHTIVVTAEGHQPATEVVTLAGNESRELSIALTPVAVTPPPKPVGKPPKAEPKPEEEPEESGGSNVPAYVTIGIAGAGVILGIVFGVQALGKKNKFEDRVEAGDATADELTEIADDAERAALIADMSFGVALTFGITGAVLLFSGGDEDEPEAKEASAMPKLLPYAGTKGGGMAATWTF